MIQNTVKTAKLIIKDEHGKERIHELVDDVTTVGRSSTNTIQVTDEKSSRSHFRIERSGDAFKLVDQGSTNGTKLNGLKIEETLELRPGDEIRLGKTTFVFEGAGIPRDQLPETEKVNMDHAQEKPVLVADKKKEENKEEKKAETREPPKKEEEKAAPTEPKYVLRVTEGKTPGAVYELGSKALTLGRHASNTIQIIDEAASNYHAEVTREPMGFVLTDLGSTNGTKVKGKEHPDFEKVVKVPLHPGMQIRIGKTIMRYENIGAPAEDDALFGTVALDSAKLGAQLNEDPTVVQRRKVVAVAAAVTIFVVGAWAISHFSGPTVVAPGPGPGTEKKTISAVNRISNSSFDEGTDDDGNPKGFTRGTGSALIKVTQDAERKGSSISDPTSRAAGLQIVTKPSGNLLATLSTVETQVGFPVDPGKAYEYSGWMRNDGNGLYGLRVTWTKGERSLSENPVVLKETQEWKEKKALLTPPPWCDSARVGVFTLGSEGRASFDDLSFRESAAEPSAPAKIAYGGVSYIFEGMKGAFTVLSQGERVLEEGTLVLEHPEKKASCDLSTASDTQWTKPDDGSLALVGGKLYDFAIPAQNEFKIEVRQSGAGVTSTLSVTQPDDAQSKPSMRFLIVGSTAAGDIDIGAGEQATERLAGADDKVVPAARSLLFNAGKSPQLELTFSKPVEATLKREGSKRRVQLRFTGELKVGFAPESVADKQKMQAMISELQKAVKEPRWGDAENAAKALSDQFGPKFAQAREEANKAREAVDKAWTACQTEITRTMAALGKAANPELIEKAVKTVQNYQKAWAGSEEKSKILADAADQIIAIKNAGANEQLEAKAEDLYKKAMGFIEAKPPVFNVGIAFLKKIINDPELSKTKAAEKAREMLPKVERKAQMKEMEDQLRDKVKNNIAAGDYKNAVREVERDVEYQNNKDEMPDLKKDVEEWKKKIK